ncbi:MAG TPA: S8 family serine peptidase [Burkholderiales bacterium]|nr:S8 family serine peptidase [Burkholderiales bacterium]
MGTSKRGKFASGTEGTTGSNMASGGGMGIVPPETTGRYLVLFDHDALEEGVNELNSIAGIKDIPRMSDFADDMSGEGVAGERSCVFEKLGIAVVDAPPDQIQPLGVAAAGGAASAIVAVEPERVVYATQELRRQRQEWVEPPVVVPLREPVSPPDLSSDTVLPLEYFQGYRDAVNRLVDKIMASAGMPSELEGEIAVAALDESEVTWGLQLTKVAVSRFSGKGIRIAVLDTGFDRRHPDFERRQITAQSFVANQNPQDAQDRHGHGTHCIGTACGPLLPNRLPRYGIAYEAEIFAGKVLNDRGRGTDGEILAGINWAITNACQIVSMSLGAQVGMAPFSTAFERVARRALKQGTLIIAAAGNESRRPLRRLLPVNHPANCPSIMAVGALDERMQVAPFSNAGRALPGGQVDIAGPGVDVYSSWIGPQLYNTIDGTSMATPHVAGIAALFAEAVPDMRGRELMSLLTQNARRLELSGQDVGAGLVQAP